MKCLVCNKETQNPKFCSKSCSAKQSNLGRNRRGTKRKNCKNCKKELNRNAYTYCSDAIRLDRLNSGKVTSTVLKTFLLKKYGAKCSFCGWEKINPVTGKCPIELDHIDGDSSNNDINNGRLLCPNCHSLQPTYKALNKGKGRHSRLVRYHAGKSY
jgi:hypothetical protein